MKSKLSWVHGKFLCGLLLKLKIWVAKLTTALEGSVGSVMIPKKEVRVSMKSNSPEVLTDKNQGLGNPPEVVSKSHSCRQLEKKS